MTGKTKQRRASNGSDTATSAKAVAKPASKCEKGLPAWRKQLLLAIPLASGAVTMAVIALRFVGEGPLAEIAERCTTLAYPVDQEDGTVRYARGFDDVYLLGFLTVASLFFRLVISEASVPLAHLMGVPTDDEVHKFKEQASQAVWYSIAWLLGMQIVTTEWNYFDTDQLWIGYPHTHITSTMKLFYLGQLSHWFSLIFITPLEAWRSDFWASMSHHILTAWLVGSSYYMHFTRVGIAILAEQDVADVFLPLAKMFNYAKWKTAANITFVIFTLVWIPTRHGMFLYIYYSLYNDSLRLITAPYNPEEGAYWTPTIWWSYLGFLGFFQFLMLFWLKQVIVAVHRAVVNTESIEDHRSDDEAARMKVEAEMAKANKKGD